MKLNIHSVHFTADQKLLNFIQTKTNKLDTFYERITSGEVYLRVSTDKDNKGSNKIVEFKLFVPGGSLFVKEQQASFEAATDIALDALKTQLKRLKDKQSVRSVTPPDALIAETANAEIDD